MSLDFGLVWDDGLAGVGAEEQWDQVSSGVPPASEGCGPVVATTQRYSEGWGSFAMETG